VEVGKLPVNNLNISMAQKTAVDNGKFIHIPLWKDSPVFARVSPGFPHKIPLLLLLLKIFFLSI